MFWKPWRRRANHSEAQRRKWFRLFLEELESRLAPSANALDLVTTSGVGYQFNNDSNPDVLTYDRQTGNVFVDLMNNQGQALGTYFVTQSTSSTLQLAGAGNWVGPGRTDILWEDTSSNQPVIWKMNGREYTQSTASLYDLPALTGLQIAGVADFDGKGTSDLLMENDANHSLAIWLMSGQNFVKSVSVSQALPASTIAVAAGDINGDGTPDILVENTSTKALTAWVLDPDPAKVGQVDRQISLGNITDPTYDYRVGGVTQLHGTDPAIVSDILLRAMNGVNQANFVDLEVSAGLGTLQTTQVPIDTLVTSKESYTRAPIYEAFMTADYIASPSSPTPLVGSTNLVPIPATPDPASPEWKQINGTWYYLLQSWVNRSTAPTTAYDVTWCSVPTELQAWYQDPAHAISADPGPDDTGFYQRAYQRTTQLLGMPNDTQKMYFAQMWVAPSPYSVWRPAIDPNYTTTSSPTGPPPGGYQDKTYPTWYNNWLTVSYVPPDPGQWPGGYPWTRLGYTYDWGDPSNYMGVSEYLLPKGASIIPNDVISNEVYWGRVYGTDQFVSAGHPITYTDDAGRTVTVTLSGNGQVEAVLPEGGGNAVAYNITGTDMQSKVVVTVSGSGPTDVNEINLGTYFASADLGSLLAPGVQLATPNTAQGIIGKITPHGTIGLLQLYAPPMPPSPSTPPYSPPPLAHSGPPPSVSVAFGPYGGVLAAVSPGGVLTLFHAAGAQTLSGGVQSVSVAYDALGNGVMDVVYQNGLLVQYDAAGAHTLFGGVQAVSVAFGPVGEVLDVVFQNGLLWQFDATGAYPLMGDVQTASVASGPFGEVLDVVFRNGILVQFDAAGAHPLLANVESVAVAMSPTGAEVIEVVFQNGLLAQLDAAGYHPLLTGVQSASVGFLDPTTEVLDVIFQDGSLFQYDSLGAHPLGKLSSGTV